MKPPSTKPSPFLKRYSQANKFLSALGGACLLSLSPLSAQNRVSWTLDNSYTGTHQEEFKKLEWEIPIFLRQTTLDLSAKLGLPYSEGWRFPLTVRFVDRATLPSENLFAYVRLYEQDDGIQQELVINLSAYVRHQFDYQQVLAHELVHAMLNDSLGGKAAAVFPVWFNEGLAVFGSGEGEERLTQSVHRYYGFAKGKILNGLEGPHGGLDYTEDYLAFKYIEDRHGTNGVPLLIQDVISKRGDVKSAISYVLNESWEEFQKNVREYSEQRIGDIKPARRGHSNQGY